MTEKTPNYFEEKLVSEKVEMSAEEKEINTKLSHEITTMLDHFRVGHKSGALFIAMFETNEENPNPATGAGMSCFESNTMVNMDYTFDMMKRYLHSMYKQNEEHAISVAKFFSAACADFLTSKSEVEFLLKQTALAIKRDLQNRK